MPVELEEYPSGRARERPVRRRLSGGEDDRDAPTTATDEEEGMTIARPRSTAGILTRDGRIGLGAMRKSESRIPLRGRRRLPERRARTTTRAAGRRVGVVAAALVGVTILIGEGGDDDARQRIVRPRIPASGGRRRCPTPEDVADANAKRGAVHAGSPVSDGDNGGRAPSRGAAGERRQTAGVTADMSRSLPPLRQGSRCRADEGTETGNPGMGYGDDNKNKKDKIKIISSHCASSVDNKNV